MPDRRSWAIIALATAIALSGCYLPRGESVDATVEIERKIPHDASNNVSLYGDLGFYGGIPDRDTYQNVTIKLYDSSENVICVRNIGDVVVSEGLVNFSLVAPERPRYITVESTDFWTEDMSVGYYVFDRQEGTFQRESAAERDEMPVWNPRSPAPECPSPRPTEDD